MINFKDGAFAAVMAVQLSRRGGVLPGGDARPRLPAVLLLADE